MWMCRSSTRLLQGIGYTFWGVKDHSHRPFMEKAFGQRRRQIVGDCLQLKTDVDVYNDHEDVSLLPYLKYDAG